MTAENTQDLQKDPLNIQQLEAAFAKLEDYIQNVAKPVTSSDVGQELQALRAENTTLKNKTAEAATRVAVLMKSLKQKGLDA